MGCLGRGTLQGWGQEWDDPRGLGGPVGGWGRRGMTLGGGLWGWGRGASDPKGVGESWEAVTTNWRAKGGLGVIEGGAGGAPA